MHFGGGGHLVKPRTLLKMVQFWEKSSIHLSTKISATCRGHLVSIWNCKEEIILVYNIGKKTKKLIIFVIFISQWNWAWHVYILFPYIYLIIVNNIWEPVSLCCIIFMNVLIFTCCVGLFHLKNNLLIVA